MDDKKLKKIKNDGEANELMREIRRNMNYVKMHANGPIDQVPSGFKKHLKTMREHLQEAEDLYAEWTLLREDENSG